MKKLIVFLLALMLAASTAMAEDAPDEPLIHNGEHALVVAVAQDELPGDPDIKSRTCFEVTVPIHLPVTVRIQEGETTLTEFTIRPAVMQITYFMEISFDGQHLNGGGVDLYNYPKLSMLGVPPYPGGPSLARGLVSKEMAFDVRYEIIERPHWGGFGTRDAGQTITNGMAGGKIRIEYPGVITMDPYGYIISAETITELITCDYDQKFDITDPVFTGETYLPTFEEWMGVESVPR